MRRFDFNIPEELFNQIKLMANFYKVPVSKIIRNWLSWNVKNGGL